MDQTKNFKPSRSAPVKYSIKLTKKTIMNTIMKVVYKLSIETWQLSSIFSFSTLRYHVLNF